MSTREPAPAKPRPSETSPFTYEMLCAMPDDGKHFEIFEGALEMTPSPTPRHQDVVFALAKLVDRHVRERNLGKVFIAPLDVVFDATNVAEPDILFVARERLSTIGEKYIAAAPDLAVEVTSSGGARDRVKKRRQYQKFGVRHYWIVDPDAARLEEYVLDGAAYRTGAVLERDEAFRPVLFPGLEIPLAQIFA